VQSARTTHQAFANKTQRRQPQYGRPFGTEAHRPEVAPISAARLAAEAAFSSPQFSSIQNQQAQITVRRARILTHAEAPVAEGRSGTEAAVRKDPRVFRIATTPTLQALPAEPAPDSERGPVANVLTIQRRPRKRNFEANKRPGPVVVLVQQQPALQPKPQPPEQAVEAMDSQTLTTSLDRFTPIMAAIQKAQSFRFMDDGTAPQWQRLSQRADELLTQLRGRTR
jgi:hypothetical protein